MGEGSTNQVVTFGCRLNHYESAMIQSLSKAAGIEDAIFINTCSVTAEAERQACQAIRKLRRERPEASIIVTGCAAHIRPDFFASMPEVNMVLGNQDKMKIASYIKFQEQTAPRVLVNDITSIHETAEHMVTGFDGRSRAFVQVQNGCDHRCTFCIIPYGRGPSRSVPLGEILQQVETLYQNGYKEFVFTGIDLTAYGLDLPGQPRLGNILQRLLKLAPYIERIRLSSLDPVEVDDDLWYLIENEPKLLPHLHLSLQAGDDMVLKRMKRRHLSHDIKDFCERVRNTHPNISLGADVIAGFPTETDEMFQNTYQLLEDCRIPLLHVFPYSARSGTPAARMPQVPKKIVKERAAELRKLGEKNFQKFCEHWVGQAVFALVEQKQEDVFLGKTDHYLPVCIESNHIQENSIVNVKIKGLNKHGLYGTV